MFNMVQKLSEKLKVGNNQKVSYGDLHISKQMNQITNPEVEISKSFQSRGSIFKSSISESGIWFLCLEIYIAITHWDFLPKFLSLHYYTTPEGVLGVQRSGQSQGTIIYLFGPLFFSQN